MTTETTEEQPTDLIHLQVEIPRAALHYLEQIRVKRLSEGGPAMDDKEMASLCLAEYLLLMQNGARLLMQNGARQAWMRFLKVDGFTGTYYYPVDELIFKHVQDKVYLFEVGGSNEAIACYEDEQAQRLVAWLERQDDPLKEASTS